MVGYALAGTAISILIGRKLVRLALPPIRKGGGFPLRPRPRAGQRGVHRLLPRRKTRAPRSVQPPVGGGRQHAPRSSSATGTSAFSRTATTTSPSSCPCWWSRPMYMSGKVEFGVVTQAAGAFATGAGRRLADHHAVRRLEQLSGQRPASRQPVGPARRTRRRGRAHRLRGRERSRMKTAASSNSTSSPSAPRESGKSWSRN